MAGMHVELGPRAEYSSLALANAIQSDSNAVQMRFKCDSERLGGVLVSYPSRAIG